MKDDTKPVVLLELDTPNKNGRIYPKATIERFLKTRGDKPLICTMGASGFDVNLNHASHIVEKLYLQDNKLMANVRVLNTPMGNIAKSLINADVEMEFVVAGYAQIGLNGVVDTFEMTHVGVVEPGQKA